LDRQGYGRASHRLLKINVDLDRVVFTPPRMGFRPPPAAPKDLPENVAEILKAPHASEISKIHVDLPAAPTSAPAERVEPGTTAGFRGPERIVLAPRFWVGKDRVRLLDFLEPALRLLVAGIHVRVELPGQLAIRLLDFVLGCILRDPENLVQITCHWALRHAKRSKI
jgi:hypothetical protein